MFRKVLIANRGDIACRVIRTLRRMGSTRWPSIRMPTAIRCTCWQADEAVRLGPAPAAESYLDADRLIEAARASGAEAIHPGYGFLSENAGFAEPASRRASRSSARPPAQMRDFGLKHTARALAARARRAAAAGQRAARRRRGGRARGASASAIPSCSRARRAAAASACSSCARARSWRRRLTRSSGWRARTSAAAACSSRNTSSSARHIEVQIFGDGAGGVVALGERDCSMQRRNQKVIEETPAPGSAPGTARRLCEAAAAAGRSGRATARPARSSSSTTRRRAEFYFLEVNTRLQVEHGVTEAGDGHRPGGMDDPRRGRRAASS